jgi:hypothetical protein
VSRLRKPNLDAASAFFFGAIFMAACIIGAFLLIELAVKVLV